MKGGKKKVKHTTPKDPSTRRGVDLFKELRRQYYEEKKQREENQIPYYPKDYYDGWGEEGDDGDEEYLNS